MSREGWWTESNESSESRKPEKIVTGVHWRKSTWSGNGGADCVEVGVWRKSAHSANNGGCVELGPCACCGTAVRDSKDPEGPKLAFSIASWRAFHADVLAGRYDLP
nr:DUF397 domain-containing protein [Actinomadura pelletieri]